MRRWSRACDRAGAELAAQGLVVHPGHGQAGGPRQCWRQVGRPGPEVSRACSDQRAPIRHASLNEAVEVRRVRVSVARPRPVLTRLKVQHALCVTAGACSPRMDRLPRLGRAVLCMVTSG